METIVVLDFGSQTAQLIARWVRELHVYSELLPWNVPAETILRLDPKGFILSGGPASVYEVNAPQVPDVVIESHKPFGNLLWNSKRSTHSLGGG